MEIRFVIPSGKVFGRRRDQPAAADTLLLF